MSKSISTIIALLFLVLIGQPILADVKPHALFTNGCVLQQGMSVPIWGTAEEGEKVAVEFQGQRESTVAQNGRWIVKLKSLKSGGPFEMKIIGNNTVTVSNVLVGEVWVGSGQSNMEMSLDRTANAEAEIAAAKYPLIHLFTVPRNPQDDPQTEVKATWKECAPENIPRFSAVAYYFGRALQQARGGVPVGLIHTSYGGTPSEAWTSRNTLDSDIFFKEILGRYGRAVESYPEAKARYDAEAERYKLEAEEAKTNKKEAPRAPQLPMGPGHQSRPAGLFNGMIAPLLPYAIRGVIWYQGEANRTRAWEYRAIFPAMIQDWRKAWKSAGGQDDFPFLLVQLAPFMKIESEPQESELAELREAQWLAAQKVPRVAMAVITDVGEQDDIHPKQKSPVGERLALAARAIAYGEKIESSGPVYSKMKIDGSRVILSFDHADHGLVVKGDKLTGFAIAGEDHKFVWAQAEVKGNKVVVSSPQVTKPVAVRFGWANYPVVNLWNKAGLPAVPFRTDDFPMLTVPKAASAQKQTQSN